MGRLRVAAFTIALLICCGGGPATAAEAGAPGEPAGAGDEKVWNLTTYLKGTPAQIRELLNGELERLLTKRKATRRSVAQTNEELATQERAAIDAVRKTPDYVKNQAEVVKAQAALEAARVNGSSLQTLDASSRFNRARAAAERMEQDAVAKDARRAALRKFLAEQQASLALCEESTARAQDWREELLGAMRNKFKLLWPLAEGRQGMLPQVMPLRIVDAQTFVTTFDAFELKGRVGEAEGIQTINIVVHKVTLRVTGFPTEGIREGTPFYLDRTVTVTRLPTNAEGDEAYTVTRAPTEADRLFEVIVPLRVDPDALADANAAGRPGAGSKKANPKLWRDLVAVLAAVPPERKPRRGDTWNGATLQRVNDWFGAEVAGDTFDGPIVFEAAGTVRDGFFELRGHIDVPAGVGRTKPHTVIVHCPATLVDKSTKLRKGQRVKVTATVRSLTMLEDDTTLLDLTDAAF